MRSGNRHRAMRPIITALLAMILSAPTSGAQRARARDLGVKPGVFPPGTLNAITDPFIAQVTGLSLSTGQSQTVTIDTTVPTHNPDTTPLELDEVPA